LNRAALALACLAALGSACGGSHEPPPVGASVVAGPERIDFAFDSLDDRPVSSAATLGKPTVIAFVQTDDPRSQAVVNFLVAMAKNDADKTNYVVVALEPRMKRELVEIYKSSLRVTFPVALADAASLNGTGPFGEWKGVPTVVILDRAGKLRWRVEGRVVKSDEMRAALRDL
jgi:hypothetical protein